MARIDSKTMNGTTPFKYAHASGLYWQNAVDLCLSQLGKIPPAANLGFLYVTDGFSEQIHDILKYLKMQIPLHHWVGGMGIGICCTGREYFDTAAMTIMLGEFPPYSFQVFSTINKELAEFHQTHRSWYSGRQALFGIVHGDPRNSQVPGVIPQFAELLDEGFLVGGLTSSRGRHVQIADRVTEGGLSGVLFSNEVDVSTRLTQGCTPLGKRHEITDCQDNVISHIDGRPAVDVFNEEIGEELAGDLSKVAGHIFVALLVQGSDTGDYLVRNLIGVDPEHKLIAIGEFVSPGTQILFAQRDGDKAREDLLRMLNSIKRGLTRPPRGGIYYSCVGRGPYLIGENSMELKMIEKVAGNFPLVGFFANGEIFHNRMYGYTGVLTLFL